MKPPAAQPLPFDGDGQRWDHAVRDEARRLSAAPADMHLVVRERTQRGWLRWDVVADADSCLHGGLREAGVARPGQGRVWVWVGRTVWGSRPPACIWTFAGHELPRPVPLGRAVVFTATALAAVGPVTAVVPAATGLLAAGVLGAAAAAGIPAVVRRVTAGRMQVAGRDEVYAPVFFRLLAAEQHLRRLAQRNERPELARAVDVLPRLLWDAAGLVARAEHNAEARELLLGYEESLALLVEQGVEVEYQEEAVESAIRREPDLPVTEAGEPTVPDGLMSRAVLDEARRELEELGHGLRHARTVLDGADSMGKGEEHA
jgi:hypothetical protein